MKNRKIGGYILGAMIALIGIGAISSTSVTYATGPTKESICKKYENDATAKTSCENCRGNPTSPECSTPAAVNGFSCETLFAKSEDARKCNWNRCMMKNFGSTDNAGTTIQDNECNCKYGVNGTGPERGIALNTDIPFIGTCLKKSGGTAGDETALNAFPTILSAATRMLMTIILLVSFIMIVVGGVQWASGDAKAGKAKITKVAIGIALLGMMGAILRLINPNFFK